MAENYITKQVEKGTINISEDVIAAMVSAAVSEVDGIAGMGTANTPELAELFGKKPVSKGLKIRFLDDKITIDVMVNVRLSGSLTEVALKVQDCVCREVESITGMGSVVNVHVTGVIFEKEK